MAWAEFLQDQRGPRIQNTTLNDKSMSLRAASILQLSQEEIMARQQERWRLEIKSKREALEKLDKEKSEQEMSYC